VSAAALALAVAFAFPNPQGTRLIATGDIARPETLRIALCSGGQQRSVQFDSRQAEGRIGSGRRTSGNFANVAGAVFRVEGAAVNSGATCVLADEAFLTGATVVPLTRPPADSRCSKATYPQIQAEKGRPVVGCWPIAQSAASIHVSIVEFSRRLSNALASLVVADGDERMYIDYAADFKGPGADLWRADDGGEIHAEHFDVICLLKKGATYLLAVDWVGAEGNALSLHAAEGPGRFKELVTDSWYRSPL
jgi:hypothetical protein